MPIYSEENSHAFKRFVQGHKFSAKFEIAIPGLDSAVGFQSISGLSLGESEEITYREGIDYDVARTYTGLISYPEVTFERGVTDSDGFVNWFRRVIDMGEGRSDPPRGRVNPQTGKLDVGVQSEAIYTDVTIDVFSRAQADPIVTWKLLDCRPVSISYGDLDANSAEILIQTLVLKPHGATKFQQSVGF